MRVRINDCLVHLESMSDASLMNLIYSLRTKREEIDDQMAAIAAERFSRRQSPLIPADERRSLHW